MRKRIILTASAVAVLAVPAAASASVNVNPDGTGFVGKGDVQTVFGWNNQKLQDNAKLVTFSGKQDVNQTLSQNVKQVLTQRATQEGTQPGVQSGMQVGTQDVTELLECHKTNGATAQQSRTGVRTGERNGERDATRDATRTGSRIGSREGDRLGTRLGTRTDSIASALNGDPRPGPNQFTGFNLKGVSGSTTTLGDADMGDTVSWDTGDRFPTDFAFGGWSLSDTWTPTGDYNWGSYDWAPVSSVDFSNIPWDTDGTNAEPDVCLNSSGNVNANVDPDSLVHTYSVGTIHDGEITDGAVTPSGEPVEGDITKGAVDYTAPIQNIGSPIVTNTTYGQIQLSVTAPAPYGTKPLN